MFLKTVHILSNYCSGFAKLLAFFNIVLLEHGGNESNITELEKWGSCDRMYLQREWNKYCVPFSRESITKQYYVHDFCLVIYEKMCLLKKKGNYC